MADSRAEVTDEELVRRLRVGDEGAARALFGRHEARLRGRVRRRVAGGLKRRLGVTDLVQDTFLAACSAISRFEDRGPGSFGRWLDQVLDHTLSDQFERHVGAAKRSVRREQSQTQGATAALSSRGRTPSSEAAHLEERAVLSRAIAAMEGDDRTVLELVHAQGLDFAEADRAMGRSAEAVRKLYGRVVMKLTRRVRARS